MKRKTIKILGILFIIFIALASIHVLNALTVTIKSEGRAVTTIYDSGKWDTHCDNSVHQECTFTVSTREDN